jgi:signal transduction histidine kinase
MPDDRSIGRLFYGSVRARLVRLALLALLPGLAISAFLIIRTYDADRAAAGAALRETARTLDQLVDREFAQAEVLLRTLAATDELAGGDLPAFDRLARATAVLGGHVVLLDRTGHELVDTARPQGAPMPAGVPAWSEPVRTLPQAGGGMAVMAMHLCPLDGRMVIPMVLPLMSGGVHQADLALIVPADSFQQLLAGESLPAGWIVSIFDQNFTLVARSLDASRFRGHKVAADVGTAITGTGEGIRTGHSLEGVPIVFAFSRSTRSHWTVSVASPVALVAETAARAFQVLLGLGWAAVAAGLLGAVIVARGIARPIEAAAVAAHSLGEGGTLAPIPPGLAEADEVAAALRYAAATLDERREALSELNRTLAARVEDRTRELGDANAELMVQRTLLHAILDHLPIGVLVRSPATAGQAEQVFYANRAAEGLLGPLAAGDGAHIPALRDALLAGERIDRSVLALDRPDGRRVDVEVSAGPILDEQGRTVLSVTTLQDISARLEAEEARRRSQRLEAVGQLTGGVAHEFNNLLMALSGALDLLGPHVDGARGLRMLDHARRAADRGGRLTRQLLAFARKQHLQVESVDLNALVAGMTELLASTLGRTVAVETVLDPAVWPAMADTAQLELVLLNLAINARDAMPGGGRISICTDCETLGVPLRPEDPPAGDYAVLRLADTGCGMSPAVQARAFEPFFTTKDSGRGTGLGLAQVLGVAQQLGGGVRIDSAEGQGTSVSVFLPRAWEPGTPAAARLPSLVLPRPQLLHGARLLLVDDDIEVRDIARGMLEDLGAVVSEAGSGAAALLLLRTGPGVDLVLADLTMPAMGGLELARHITAWQPDLPVVLMSGYGAEGTGENPEGVQAVLQKPFRAADLAAVLAAALGRELVGP